MNFTWVCKYCNGKKECEKRWLNGEEIDTEKCEADYYNEQENQWERDNDK